MKRIALNGEYGKGKYGTVDDEDFEYLRQFKWYIDKTRKGIYAYRIIKTDQGMTTERMAKTILKTEQRTIINYRDGNTLNNRKTNMELGSWVEAGAGRKIGRNNKTGYKGVVQYGDFFRPKIKVDGKAKWLGVYETAIEAGIAYNWGALEDFGEVAQFNDIPNWRNIRPVPRNKKDYIRKDSKTGIRGISFYGGKYKVRKYKAGVHYNLGSFSTLEEAKEALQKGINQ